MGQKRHLLPDGRGDVKSRETTKGNVNTYSKIVGSVTNEEHYENQVTHEYFCQRHTFKETWHVAGGGGFHEVFLGAMTQFFMGASTTLGFANRFEVFLGAEQQVNLGLMGEFMVGGSFSLSAGPSLELETSSLLFWLARKDTGLKDLEAKLSETTALLLKMTPF